MMAIPPSPSNESDPGVGVTCADHEPSDLHSAVGFPASLSVTRPPAVLRRLVKVNAKSPTALEKSAPGSALPAINLKPPSVRD